MYKQGVPIFENWTLKTMPDVVLILTHSAKTNEESLKVRNQLVSSGSPREACVTCKLGESRVGVTPRSIVDL